MDIEVIFHGVPSGQDYYGIKEEWANVELFYDGSTEPVKFVIETKKQGGKAYTYYTYLRYGLMGSGGRSGSYFGLTLRFDQYYSDTLHIYNLLDIVFKRHIVGTLLTPAGDAYKYTSGGFAQKATEINQAQQALIQLVLTTCSPAKFMNMDEGFIRPITVAPTANIADVSEAIVLASIRKYSKVILSPVFETNKEKEYKKKLQEAEGKGGNIAAEKDKKIAEKDSTITSLNAQVTTLQNQIAALEQDSKKKETEIQQLRQKGDLAQQVAKIKEPITAIAEYFRVKDPKPQAKNYGHKNYILNIIICGVLVVVLALCIYAVFGNSGGGKDLKKLQAQVATLSNEKQQLTNEIKLKDAKISELQKKINQLSSSSTTTKTTLNIDVAGYSSGKLSSEKMYVVTIKHKGKKYNGQGTWKIANAELKRGRMSDPQITIQPDGKGKVTLEYVASENNCQCEARVIDVEKPKTQNPPQQVTDPAKDINFSIVITPAVNEVEIGQVYTFTILGYDGKGKWSFDGFEPQVGTYTDNKIEVKAKKGSKGYSIAKYTPDGGKEQSLKFNYMPVVEK